ncbi:hypothetical protein Nepgr_017846 [Nepenthes gracilis]|uniref:NADP-dependent oxidoreductase domain-containing protein n=1 Tax=Nepenthes gracilis TaxID=150966 RepID=A0AAD3XTS2_NEPGR|nr:hypothetical protein Nepgr_017846 [Nepenthes gracilis]
MKKDSTTFELENFLPADIPSTWKTMTAIYASGRAKVIGVSNFSMRKLEDLLAIAGIPPTINQVQCHPSWQQSKLHVFQSFVFIRAKEGSANVAYLEDMYENKREHKKVQVRWFLMLTVQTFHVDINVVRVTERIRNFGEQQCFLKVHSGAEYGKKIAYEPLCQDIKYYMSTRRLFTLKNVEFSKSWEGRVLMVDQELEFFVPRQVTSEVTLWIRITCLRNIRGAGKKFNMMIGKIGMEAATLRNGFRFWVGYSDKLDVKGPRRPTLHRVSNGLIDHMRVYIPGETLFLNDSSGLMNLQEGARCKAENPIGESTPPLAKRPGGRRSYVGHGTPDALALKNFAAKLALVLDGNRWEIDVKGSFFGSQVGIMAAINVLQLLSSGESSVGFLFCLVAIGIFKKPLTLSSFPPHFLILFPFVYTILRRFTGLV